MSMAPLIDSLKSLRKHLVVVIIVGVGTGLSTALFFITRELEEQRTRKSFELIASQQIDAVKTMITAHTEFVYSIRSFYNSADDVDRQEFRAFVTSAITRHPSIRAAAWVPRVPAARRKAYEESAREDGQTGFQIREQNLHGALVVAEQRNEYYPLYYIEPSVEFKPIFGFDIASDPYLMSQLRLSLDSPLVVATKSLQSMHFPRKDSGALIALSIFDNHKSTTSPEERQRNLRGFVLALYDLGHLIRQALAHLPGNSNELLVTEITDSLEKLPLYHYTGEGRPVPKSNVTEPFKGKAPLLLHTPVKVANRNWNLQIIAGPGSFARTGFRAEWANLIIGLLFTGLLGLYFLKIKERTLTLAAARLLAEHRMGEAEGARRDAERAERALARQAKELVLSNEELQRFAYTVSHDLQEPLRMVSSYVQLLAKRYQGTLDSNADDFIGYAIEGANRMKRMINDLLTYSRIGNSVQPRFPIETEASLKQAIANLKLAADETQAVITNDPLPTLQADETQLIQLFQNLIGNAIKFHGQRPPQIHISAQQTDEYRVSSFESKGPDSHQSETSNSELETNSSHPAFGNPQSKIQNPKSEEWLFSIHDNGIGFEPKDAEGLFTVFHRLHDKEKYSGTGIGLAVCKRIVERHGGRIWVESRPGQGTTFYFTMPSIEHEGNSQ